MKKKDIAFDRSKIYEKLDYLPEPQDYHSTIPWIIQQQIAATNGIHYGNRIGQLKTYPLYELPVISGYENNIMLDIGSGWGRWLVAGAKKDYIPIGVDLRLEFCKTARTMMADMNLNGYTVVGDLENLPFKNNVFDLIWSFSVIQHTHHDRLTACLHGINRILNNKGFAKLQFPNKMGIRNKLGGHVKRSEQIKDDYNNWCVRYYSPYEYKSIFDEMLDNFRLENHSVLGIGVLKDDLKYVSNRNKIFCNLSLLLSSITKSIPSLKLYSDSFYISATKRTQEKNTEVMYVTEFLKHHQNSPQNNLNIIPLLRCPKFGGSLKISSDKKKAISEEAGIYYPIINDIPILISSECISGS